MFRTSLYVLNFSHIQQSRAERNIRLRLRQELLNRLGVEIAEIE